MGDKWVKSWIAFHFLYRFFFFFFFSTCASIHFAEQSELLLSVMGSATYWTRSVSQKATHNGGQEPASFSGSSTLD